jgi:hypothetical protein
MHNIVVLDIEYYQNKKYLFPGIYRLRLMISLGRFCKGTYTLGRKLITLLLVPFYFLVYPFKFLRVPKVKRFEYELGLFVMAKNEGDYLEEWIKYHHSIGVDVFYVYDNESTDNTYEVLKPYIDSGLVKYKKIKGKGRHLDCYNMTINNERKKCKYIGFIDADEFIYVEEGLDLKKEINKAFESKKDIGGVVFNWMIFGSSHILQKDNRPVTQKFLYHSNQDFEENYHVKGIVNPRLIMDYRNTHFAIYRKGYFAYNLSGEKVIGPFNLNMSNLKIRINHYFTRSKDEFIAKRNRGLSDQPGIRSLEEFEKFDRNEIYDDSMLRFSEIVKK